MEAEAALKCTHATIGLYFKEEKLMSTYTHSYPVSIIDDGKEIYEVIWGECMVKKIKLIYERRCACGLKFVEETSAYIYEHSDCGTYEE